MDILKSLSVLILVILAGIASRYFKIFQKEDAKKISSFVYYFSLPALFLVNISRLNILSINKLLLVGSLGPITLVLLVLLLMYFVRLIKKDNFILYSLASVFGSNAFFGLALFENFKGGLHYQKAIITASLLGMFGIVISLLLFEYSARKVSFKKIFNKLSVNPLIISIILGIIFSLFGFDQSFFHDALDLLGKTATGVATFILGIFIYDHISWQTLRKSLALSMFRFMALPAAGYILISILAYQQIFLSFDLKQFLILQTGIPAAISLAIFAERYNYKIKELTGLIIITSLFCFLLIGGLYFIYQ